MKTSATAAKKTVRSTRATITRGAGVTTFEYPTVRVGGFEARQYDFNDWTVYRQGERKALFGAMTKEEVVGWMRSQA